MKTIKRLLSTVLIACLLITALVPAALAAEPAVAQKIVKYSFQYLEPLGLTSTTAYNDYKTTMGTAYNNEVINSMIYQFSTSGGPAITTNGISKGSLAQNDWIAFKIKAPGTGSFNVTVLPYSGSKGPSSCAVYILDGDTEDVAAEIQTATQVGNDVSLKETKAPRPTGGSFGFSAENDDYIVVFKITAAGSGMVMPLAGLQLTKSCTSAEDTAAQISNAPLGSTVTLQADCDATGKEITVGAGVTLDLNGKTLTANVTGSGTVTDSSTGSTGKIVGESAVQKVGENEIALYDGTTTRIVGYTLSASAAEEVKNEDAVSAVNFRYTFKLDNPEVYKMIAEDTKNAGFTIGATLSFNGATEDAKLIDGTVSGWASEMAKNADADCVFYVRVTGFETLGAEDTGDLGVQLTLGGAAGTAKSEVVNYTID